MQGDKVWLYPPEKKEKEYPQLLQDEFPGISSPLDAAVECHRGECQEEGVLFFQGQTGLGYEHLEQWWVGVNGYRRASVWTLEKAKKREVSSGLVVK